MALRNVAVCSHAIVNSATGGVVPVVPAVSGQGVAIYRMLLTAQAQVTVTIQDTAGKALSQAFVFGNNGGVVVIDDTQSGEPWWSSKGGCGIQLFATAAVGVSMDIWYLQGVVQGS